MSIPLDSAFRGSRAVAAGLLTWGQLRGPRFQRLFPDVYAPARLEPDLALRSRGAAVLVDGRGVLAGYSAAEVLGASCGARSAPAEVLMLRQRGQDYRCPGLRVHRDLVEPGETTTIGGIAVTSPVRTAFDLARWAPTFTEKVVGVDALAYHRRVTLDAIAVLAEEHPGAHGGRELVSVLRLADARSESPMESRIRMALVMEGLPAPDVQHEVLTGGRCYRLDLAYPSALLAVEYDGDEHRTQSRAHRDLAREAALVALGWKILRFEAHLVLLHPSRVAREVEYHLRRRARVVG